ncbi:S-layer family protein [Oscillatoriales cyanobacterium LEGE 11467]|uniref:S-layer family protein n=1 Tax=Zarconia navalis LEGE 11467 TaxID=1828826 RepID=A0A928W281_9CYAN|nr:S-layer family protein [Zarconia navalis LEGE 11467]
MSSINLGSGLGGDITISTDRLRLVNGGNISNLTLGIGNTGDIAVNVTDTIEVLGTNALVSSPSVISVSSFNRGDSGRLTVNASKLILQDGGAISSGTLATGNAGNATFDVSESIEVRGVGEDGEPSRISASAEILPPVFQQIFGLPPTPSGNTGNVIVNTPVLRVGDGGVVTVEHQGSGDAGFLEVNADRIFLDRSGEILAATTSGQGGNISLNVRDSLQLRNGAAIDAESFGVGNGGNIQIDSDTIALLENSRINANAIEGTGGNIQITTSGLFVSPDSRITASSQFGVDGTVNINNSIVDPASGLVTLDADPLNANTQIQDSCEIATRSRFAITGNGGLPEDPTQPLQPSTVWRDTRLSEIQSHLTPSSVEVEAEAASALTAPLVEATGWRTNNRGHIELIAASGNPSYSPWQPQPDCESLPDSDRTSSNHSIDPESPRR